MSKSKSLSAFGVPQTWDPNRKMFSGLNSLTKRSVMSKMTRSVNGEFMPSDSVVGGSYWTTIL
jgi:hypothetical protein